MRGITKRFPGVCALDSVDFQVRAGEVHALMGENGAGKSTLVKVLTGVHRPDAGALLLAGGRFEPSSPADAQRHGVHAVYQELNLIPTLSVAENLYLGRLPKRWYGADWRAARRRARQRLAEFNLSIDVSEPLGSFPAAIQQMVAVIRAVDANARLLVLDEPTSSLDRRETEILFANVARLKQEGLGIVYITHFLAEVYEVADRITVLRNGRRVGTFLTDELPRIELVAHMLGRSTEEATQLETQRPMKTSADGAGKCVLAAQQLGRRRAIAPFDIRIQEGEVVGFAGLLGAGRTEAARLLFGADRADEGQLAIGGRRVRRHDPRRAVRAGIAFSPEDRKASGIVPDMSIRSNIALVAQRFLSRFGIVSRALQDRVAEEFVERLGIRTPDLDRPVRHLSGGNQQKVILARWLASRPVLVILDEPTRGIDVGAKAEVEALIGELADRGVAVVFISSELEEVLRRANRILVFRDRRIVGELAGRDTDMLALMNAIANPDTQAG